MGSKVGFSVATDDKDNRVILIIEDEETQALVKLDPDAETRLYQFLAERWATMNIAQTYH